MFRFIFVILAGVLLTSESIAQTYIKGNNLVVSGDLSLSNRNQIKFFEPTSAGTNFLSFKAPPVITANVNWILPSGDGTSGQLLSTDGSGNFLWASANTNLLTTSGDITIASGDNNPARLPRGTNGQVLQIASGLPRWTTLALSLFGIRIEWVSFGGSGNIVTANTCASSPCNMYTKSSGVSSVTRSNTGKYKVNWGTAWLSFDPTCVANVNFPSGSAKIASINPESSTVLAVDTLSNSNAFQDNAVSVICVGFN